MGRGGGSTQILPILGEGGCPDSANPWKVPKILTILPGRHPDFSGDNQKASTPILQFSDRSPKDVYGCLILGVTLLIGA